MRLTHYGIAGLGSIDLGALEAFGAAAPAPAVEPMTAYGIGALIGALVGAGIGVAAKKSPMTGGGIGLALGLGASYLWLQKNQPAAPAAQAQQKATMDAGGGDGAQLPTSQIPTAQAPAMALPMPQQQTDSGQFFTGGGTRANTMTAPASAGEQEVVSSTGGITHRHRARRVPSTQPTQTVTPSSTSTTTVPGLGPMQTMPALVDGSKPAGQTQSAIDAAWAAAQAAAQSVVNAVKAGISLTPTAPTPSIQPITVPTGPGAVQTPSRPAPVVRVGQTQAQIDAAWDAAHPNGPSSQLVKVPTGPGATQNITPGAPSIQPINVPTGPGATQTISVSMHPGATTPMSPTPTIIASLTPHAPPLSPVPSVAAAATPTPDPNWVGMWPMPPQPTINVPIPPGTPIYVPITPGAGSGSKPLPDLAPYNSGGPKVNPPDVAPYTTGGPIVNPTPINRPAWDYPQPGILDAVIPTQQPQISGAGKLASQPGLAPTGSGLTSANSQYLTGQLPAAATGVLNILKGAVDDLFGTSLAAKPAATTLYTNLLPTTPSTPVVPSTANKFTNYNPTATPSTPVVTSTAGKFTNYNPTTPSTPVVPSTANKFTNYNPTATPSTVSTPTTDPEHRSTLAIAQSGNAANVAKPNPYTPIKVPTPPGEATVSGSFPVLAPIDTGWKLPPSSSSAVGIRTAAASTMASSPMLSTYAPTTSIKPPAATTASSILSPKASTVAARMPVGIKSRALIGW